LQIVVVDNDFNVSGKALLVISERYSSFIASDRVGDKYEILTILCPLLPTISFLEY